MAHAHDEGSTTETNGGFFKSFLSNLGIGNILGAGVGAYGYNSLLENFEGMQEGLPDTLAGIKTEVQGAGQFQPWSVRTQGLGSSGINPKTGELFNQLSDWQRQQSNFQGHGAQNMFQQSMNMDPRFAGMSSMANQRGANAYGASQGQMGNSAFATMGSNQAMMNSLQDTGQREGDIYERIRAMQRPGEERQYSSMNAGLFGSGRGGMTSAAFGGSPEQHAFGKAQAEARNAASFGAMGQAQSEMMNQGQLAGQFGSLANQYSGSAAQYGGLANQYGSQAQSALLGGGQLQGMQANIGNQMFQNQYQPYQQLQSFGAQGLQQGAMQNQSGQNMAGLLAQLGIGGMTTDVNFANVQGESLVGLLEMIGSALSGAGNTFGS